ncbi:Eco57I restriction-modification methylase domain-containing protein [Candidatus Spongiisocius sp.]|uniref:Eco57I restriction-modification methylase domain-containing protein n=1 Tax=Candidatus Spongiisocius sp. TaxID=3101273 RepID=UPI003B58E068
MANVTSVGALLPRDLLDRIDSTDPTLTGLDPTAYGLVPGERVRDAVTRSWNRLVGVWGSFRHAESRLTDADLTATSLTRARWLRPLFDELGFFDLPLVHSLAVGGKDYPVSHQWDTSVPVHLLGCRVPVDRRTSGVQGAAKASPHSLVQEFLNRSDGHLWGIVSNGLVLRLLRDNASLTRAAYCEFDLQGIFDGEAYSDFVLLWLICHRTRFEGDPPEKCVLEQWSTEAAAAGTRALDRLREGVEKAIIALGEGFLSHRNNSSLRVRLRSGDLAHRDYLLQLLRLVYRLIFLLVAEGRDLLLDPKAGETARVRYRQFYSVERLRKLAASRRGTPHDDLWQSLWVTMTALDSNHPGIPALGLVPRGSFLWSPYSIGDLAIASIDNRHLLAAIRRLSRVRDVEAKAYRAVDYRNLGTREIGSVYESLLELNPMVDVDARTFNLVGAAGSERKATGSYYTPESLISRLLDEALDPILDKAERSDYPERALLDLRVLDPACGSGHFLISAAHRIAGRLATVRVGGIEPTPDDLRLAVRDVVGRCLYGIDINPMAVELCKLSLWLEANDNRRPLGFLDHHIVCGNSLLGATPELLEKGVPSEAFKALVGDNKKWASHLRKTNRAERKQRTQGQLALEWSPFDDASAFAQHLAVINTGTENTAEDVAAKEGRFSELHSSSAFIRSKLAADAWCSAFVISKDPGEPAITDATVRALGGGLDVGEDVRARIRELSEEYRFIHLHLSFPDVLDATGFDTVIGNPPFLNQLRDTTVTQRHAANLQANRYKELTSAYTDTAYLFLALSCEATRPVGGRVGLVQPESFLAADGASALRREISSSSTLEFLWVAGEKVFSAEVLTCAVVVRRGPSHSVAIRRAYGGAFEAMPDLMMSMAEVAQMPTWGPLIAEGFGVPQVRLATKARLGDVLGAAADFRDQYYGLIPFVTEVGETETVGEVGTGMSGLAPLITVGLIDPLHNRWGETSTRFAKRRWRAPAVDIDRLRTNSDLGEWADRRLVPKLLVATQTKVLEVLPDEEGVFLPSVPVITVVPDSISLWHAAALLTAPPLTAWAAARHLGASLSTSAMKLSARQIEDLPLPPKSEWWDVAASHAQDAYVSRSVGERSVHLRRLAHAMCVAYGVDDSDDLVDWWTGRLPQRR